MSDRTTSYGSDHSLSPVKESHGRILIVKIILIVVFCVIALRLVQVHVIEAPKYRELAKRQYLAPVILPAARGNIYDRNGKVLVSNTMYLSFAADPTLVATRAAVADRFARVFNKPREFYLSRLRKGSTFVYLERGVKPEFAPRIMADELDGVIQLNEPKRLYHYEHIGGQLIGFTGTDYIGLSGIEFLYDKQLAGKNGHVVFQRDGLGRRKPSVDYPRIEPVKGQSIVLTIDLEYQAIAEEELRKGVERNKAQSGVVVMMAPSTGEVLAMANYPGINPGNPSRADTAAIRNRAITDMFEPGSVFKVVTAAAALERDLVSQAQKFYAEQGRYVVNLGGGKTRTITDTHRYGMLTFREGVEYSSNIVFAKVSDLIGAELLYTTARNFGFGIASGVGLPGEAPGELKKPSSWSKATLNSMAYGYEVHATPIQIAAAYGALANRGTLMKPYVVKQILNENDEVVVETHPQVIRNVSSPATAELLTEILVGAVERGTGVQAKPKDVVVAGKTGTSRKYVQGKYVPGSYTASFVGYFPPEEPEIVCLVMLDNPAGEVYTGGLSAAPIFRAITQKVVATSDRFAQRPQVLFVEKDLLAVPDVSTLSLRTAEAMLNSSGFEVEVSGGGTSVARQLPLAGTKISRGEVVKLLTAPVAAVPQGLTVVPDVRGLSLRRAINRMTMAQLDVRIEGSGVVASQSLLAGDQTKVGTRVTLRCEPKRVTIASLY